MNDTTQDDLCITVAAVEILCARLHLGWELRADRQKEDCRAEIRSALKEAVPHLAPRRVALGPIARRIINRRSGAGSPGVWLESHLQQYTDAVRALGDRAAS